MVVFICGTYTDLAAERQAVFDAVRSTQYEHQAMEFFGAHPDRPIETCLQEVGKSNALVVIVGFLYGSLIPGSGMSYTEAEYEEGRRLEKPCYVYLRDEDALIRPRDMESDPSKWARLRNFRETLQQRHTVVKFRDSAELGRQVAADLSRFSVKRERAETPDNVEALKAEALTLRELAIAADIQRAMLPQGGFHNDRLEVEGLSVPCRTVGGDYYNYVARPDGSLAVVIADSTGKSIPAAMYMTSLEGRLRILIEDDYEPAELITRLNRSMCNRTTHQFATVFFASLNPQTGGLLYCNAGHVPPMIARKDGSVERLSGGGMVIGLLQNVTYEQFTTTLDGGDVLLLYSDGVTEASTPSGEEFGEDRLAALLRESRGRSVKELGKAIVGAAQDWFGDSFSDDLTLVAARRL